MRDEFRAHRLCFWGATTLPPTVGPLLTSFEEALPPRRTGKATSGATFTPQGRRITANNGAALPVIMAPPKRSLPRIKNVLPATAQLTIVATQVACLYFSQGFFLTHKLRTAQEVIVGVVGAQASRTHCHCGVINPLKIPGRNRHQLERGTRVCHWQPGYICMALINRSMIAAQ